MAIGPFPSVLESRTSYSALQDYIKPELMCPILKNAFFALSFSAISKIACILAVILVIIAILKFDGGALGDEIGIKEGYDVNTVCKQ